MEVVTSEAHESGCSLLVVFDAVRPESLWESFTDAEKLTEWWPDGADTDVRAGGRYHLWWEAMGWHLRGEYSRIDRDHLTFTWAWDHEQLPDRTVDVRLTTNASGAEMTLEHSAGSGEEAQSYLDGWLHFLPQLAERSQLSPPS